MKDIYVIAVVPGDGIGPEVVDAAIVVLNAAWDGSSPLRFKHFDACARHYLNSGESQPQATLDGCRKADAILHGAGGLPGVVHPDGTEAGLVFTLTLRTDLDLFANVRPNLRQASVESTLKGNPAIDYMIVRENSEGLYAARGAGSLLHNDVAVDTLVQTRKGIERVVRFAFKLAKSRNGSPGDGKRRVTCCDKANVLRACLKTAAGRPGGSFSRWTSSRSCHDAPHRGHDRLTFAAKSEDWCSKQIEHQSIAA